LGQGWSLRRLRRTVGDLRGKAIGDFGCGYEAVMSRPFLDEVRSATLADLAISPALKARPNVVAIEGALPEALERVQTASLDVVLCNNVLEHLWAPGKLLAHMRRSLRSGGTGFVNVPSWRGRIVLETLSFRFGLVSFEEVDDHKRYYSTHELWQALVDSGFRPCEIVACATHKFGCNVFAACRVG
jgi:SAM-dependent methyltransferase